MKDIKKPLIIAISGKKQSGKSTLCDYLKGKEADIEIFSFADSLKQKVCVDILGLTYNQVFGTDEDKNSLTRYTWDKLPKFIREAYSTKINDIPIAWSESGKTFQYESYTEPRTGQMTAREIMQIVGTDIFRNMFDDSVWVDSTIRDIKASNCTIALIADCRFPSEVNIVLEQGGSVIRLTRSIDNKDLHPSETALDDYPFDTTEGCFVINNHNKSIEWKNEQVKLLMESLRKIRNV